MLKKIYAGENYANEPTPPVSHNDLLVDRVEMDGHHLIPDIRHASIAKGTRQSLRVSQTRWPLVINGDAIKTLRRDS